MSDTVLEPTTKKRCVDELDDDDMDVEDRMDLDATVSSSDATPLFPAPALVRWKPPQKNTREEMLAALGMHVEPKRDDLQGKVFFQTFEQKGMKGAYELPDEVCERMETQRRFLHVIWKTLDPAFSAEWMKKLADIEATGKCDDESYCMIRYFVGLSSMHWLQYENQDLHRAFVNFWVGSYQGQGPVRTRINWSFKDYMAWLDHHRRSMGHMRSTALGTALVEAKFTIETIIPQEWLPLCLVRQILFMNGTQEIEGNDKRYELQCPDLLPWADIIGHWRLQAHLDTSFQRSARLF